MNKTLVALVAVGAALGYIIGPGLIGAVLAGAVSAAMYHFRYFGNSTANTQTERSFAIGVLVFMVAALIASWGFHIALAAVALNILFAGMFANIIVGIAVSLFRR